MSIWDLWNLTCLGDVHAWPFARMPRWATDAVGYYPMPNDSDVSYLAGLFPVRGFRKWPEWLREPALTDTDRPEE